MRLGTPIDYFSSHQRHSSRLGGHQPAHPIPNHWRRQALLVIAFGLLTFFFPLTTTDAPIAGIVHWSAFDIAQQMYRGNLPPPFCERCAEPAVRALVGLPLSVSLTYLLMICTLLPLSVPYTSHIVATMAGLGVLECVDMRRYSSIWDFEKTFYRNWSHQSHVHNVWLRLTLTGVMATLLLIAANGD